MTVAYLLLYGNGWTQRWSIASGMEEHVRSQISQVGTDATGQLTVVDPGSDAEATLMIAWALVATAVVIDGAVAPASDDSAGRYA